MLRSYSIKKGTKSKLPSLQKSNTSLISNYSSKQGQFVYMDKMKKTLQSYPDKIQSIKAYNFISKSNIIGVNSPEITFVLSEHVRKQTRKIEKSFMDQFQDQRLNSLSFSRENKGIKQKQQKKLDQRKKNSFYWLKQTFKQEKQNISNIQPIKSINIQTQNHKNQHNLQKISQNFKKHKPKQLKYGFQRLQIINLSQWIDNELKKFHSSDKINVNDLIEYKQHILNYGLGKLMDSISKHCREQGQLLKILWQNSFKIFEKILSILSTQLLTKQSTHVREQLQTKQVYDLNLNILQNENEKVSREMEELYEKMRKVIKWNKSLRSEKKNLSIKNKILEYRNETYAQGLEETIDVLLKNVPEPAIILFSKRIIAKLAKEKRNKKKGELPKIVQDEFRITAKEYVNSWLRRNGFMQDGDFNPITHLTTDEKVQLQNIDDENKINSVDIYDYFKLLDIGVQANEIMVSQSTQFEVSTVHKQTMTQLNRLRENIEVQVQLSSPSDDCENCKRIRNEEDQSNKKQKQDQKKSLKDIQSQNLIKRMGSKKVSMGILKTTEKKGQGLKFSAEKNQKAKNKVALKKSNQVGDKKVQKSSLKIIDKTDKIEETLSELDARSTISDDKNTIDRRNFTIISEMIKEQSIFDEDEKQLQNFPSSPNKLAQSQYSPSNQANHYIDTQKGITKHFQKSMSIRRYMQSDFNDDIAESTNLKDVWRKLQKNKDDSKKEGYENVSQKSMKFIKQDDDMPCEMKKLEKKYFTEFYKEIKASNDDYKQSLVLQVVRKRSFYKKYKTIFDNSSSYEQNKFRNESLSKTIFGTKSMYSKKNPSFMEQEENERLNEINRKFAIPSNLMKARTFINSKQTFKQISEFCKDTKKQPPKNKQYFNSSLLSINKYISSLLQDYIKQIKRQRDGVTQQCEKTFYPLHTLLMEKMNHKYGLKDISEKKIKDFIEKTLTFAQVNEKIGFYSLLFGMDKEGVGADELLIYLKCIVYLQTRPTKATPFVIETNLSDTLLTDTETVKENLDKILRQFFDGEGIEQTKKEIFEYVEKSTKNSFSIQKIAELLISSFLKRKQLFNADCNMLYQMCIRSKNIFNNLYKLLNFYNNHCSVFNENEQKEQTRKSKPRKFSKNHKKKYQPLNITKVLTEFVKRSDIIDEIQGKTITFERFLTAFMVSECPKFEVILRMFHLFEENFVLKYQQLSNIKQTTLKLPKQHIKTYCPLNVDFMEKITKTWKIRWNERHEKDTWQWIVVRSITDNIENHTKDLIGNLEMFNVQIGNFFYQTENKAQKSQVTIN